MNILININEKIIVLKNIEEKNETLAEKNIGIFDVDYSLIRYIGKQLLLQDITLSSSNYPIIKRKNDTYTTIHRFILEYYSKYDEGLKKALEDKNLEINHRNKDRLDARICNLEIVTHKNNIKHMYGNEYETIISTETLKTIQQKSLIAQKQKTDKEYLNRVSGLFYKFMETGKADNKIFKCCYYKLKNNNMVIYNSCSFSSYGNGYQMIAIPKFMYNFHTKSIQDLIINKEQYVYRTIIKNNITVLKRNIVKYPYLKEILKKYKLVDMENPNNNILMKFYEYAYNSKKYTINNGNILVVLSIQKNFRVPGKYKAFIILYLLGILQRQKYITKINKFNREKKPHIPSFIWIVPLKDEDFKKINIKAKELLKLKWNSVKYFMVAQEFGEEKANSIYSNNKRCKYNYRYSLKAKDDIINMLIMDKSIFLEGIITRKKIFNYIKELNNIRKAEYRSYNKVYKGFYNFISSILLYNTEVKEVLESLGLSYTRLNTKIINNIKQYQNKNGIDDSKYNLKPNMKVIVLKSLL